MRGQGRPRHDGASTVNANEPRARQSTTGGIFARIDQNSYAVRRKYMPNEGVLGDEVQRTSGEVESGRRDNGTSGLSRGDQ